MEKTTEKIHTFFINRILGKEGEVDVFLKKIREDIYEYKENTKTMFTQFNFLTKYEVFLFGEERRDTASPEQRANSQYASEAVAKRDDLYKKVKYSLETCILIKKKQQDTLLKLLEDAERVYRDARDKWKKIKTPKELAGDGDGYFEDANKNKEEFEKRIKIFNNQANTIIRRTYIFTNAKIFVITLSSMAITGGLLKYLLGKIM